MKDLKLGKDEILEELIELENPIDNSLIAYFGKTEVTLAELLIDLVNWAKTQGYPPP